MKYYKHDEWDLNFGKCGYFDPDQNIYIDLEGNQITGILENFYYFNEGDPRNNVYVEDGKRNNKEIQ